MNFNIEILNLFIFGITLFKGYFYFQLLGRFEEGGIYFYISKTRLMFSIFGYFFKIEVYFKEMIILYLLGLKIKIRFDGKIEFKNYFFLGRKGDLIYFFGLAVYISERQFYLFFADDFNDKSIFKISI